MDHRHDVSRRFVLGGLAASAALPARAEAPARTVRPPRRPGPVVASTSAAVRGEPEGGARIVDAARLTGAVGFVVAEARSGRVLEAFNADLALPPASVAKTMTAFYALDRLGADAAFATQVLATGPVEGGRIVGDLALAGSGDPSLDTDRLGDLAARLAATGVREVTGRYLAYAGDLPHIEEIDPGQPDWVGYNPAVSGLNLNFNRVYCEWARAAGRTSITLDARGERFVPPVGMVSVTPVDRARPVFAYAAGKGRDIWTVAAGSLGAKGGRWLPVRHPEAYAAEVFATLMAAHGLRLPPAQVVRARPAGRVLAGTRSEPLTGVMREMLKFSTNLTAETLGLAATRAPDLRRSGADMSAWAKDRYGIEAYFTDHSGLAGDNRIAASQLVRTLRAAQDGALPGLLRDYALRDAGGKPVRSPVLVNAKTGTLNFVSALAGYIVPPAGEALVFAILGADTARRDAVPMGDRERPAGSPSWIGRARGMQARLVSRWGAIYA